MAQGVAASQRFHPTCCCCSFFGLPLHCTAQSLARSADGTFDSLSARRPARAALRSTARKKAHASQVSQVFGGKTSDELPPTRSE